MQSRSNAFVSRVRTWIGSTRRRQAKTPSRRMLLEELSPRHLMAGLDEIVSNFNYGMLQLRANAEVIASNGFSEDIPNNLPLIGERDFDETIAADREVRKLFSGSISNASTIDEAIGSLTGQGFVVQRFDTNPDVRGDFIRLSKKVTTAPVTGLQLPVVDLEGINYFQNSIGDVSGILTGSVQSYTSTFIVGLDTRGFYLGEQSKIAARGISFNGNLQGQVDIGVLDEVTFTGRGTVAATVNVRFQDVDRDAKIRIGDLRNGSVVIGSMSSAQIGLRNLAFRANIVGVGTVPWTGTLRASVTNNRLTTSENLVAPSYSSLVRGMGLGFTEGIRQLDWMQRINSYLQVEIPHLNKSIGSLLDTQDIVDKALTQIGINHLPQAEQAVAMRKLIRGDNVDLAFFNKSFQVSLGEIDIVSPIVFGQLDLIPGILGGRLTGSVTGELGLSATVHVGLGSKGFWINDQTSVGIEAGVYGNLTGEIHLLSIFRPAQAKVSLGAQASATLRITSPVAGSDRTYLQDLRVPRSEIPAALASQMSLDMKVALAAKIKAKLGGITVFKRKIERTVLERHEGPKAGNPNPLILRRAAILDDSHTYEAESLPVIGQSPNMVLENQNMAQSPRVYGGQRQLSLRTQGPGWAELELNSANEVRYALNLHATRGSDQAAIRVLLNGQILAAHMDLYQLGPATRDESIDLGFVDLNRGRNVLRIEVVPGQGRRQDNALVVGLDGIELTDPSYFSDSVGKVESIELVNRGQRYVDLRWPALSSASHYQIELLRNGTWGLLGATSGGRTTFRIDPLSEGTTYRARVIAFNAMGSGEPTEMEFRTLETLPNAPTGLVIENTYGEAFDLRWTDNSHNEAEFRIAMSRDGIHWGHVASTVPNRTSVRIGGLQPLTRYWFQVRAANSEGYSEYTNVVSKITKDIPPAAPTDLTLENRFADALDLRWKDNSNNESEFRVAISTDGINWRNIATPDRNETTVRIPNLQANTRYWFQVRAANAEGHSEYTNVLEATTRVARPTAPAGLVAANVWATQIDLNWTDRSNNELGFQIEISVNGGGWQVVRQTEANRTSVRISGLTSGRNYAFRIAAFNEEGLSDYSNVLNVRTK